MLLNFLRRLPLFVLFGFSLFGFCAPWATAATATTTALTSNLNPSAFGQTVTFTAAVSGSSPTGTVTFTDTTGGYTLGAAPLSGGVATLGTIIPGGSRQIVASYAGDTINSASTSAALTQNVTKTNTSTVLTSNPNPSPYGDGITFTITITGSNPGGTVTLTDATTSTTYIATSISSGVATFATSTPFRNIIFAAGPHSMTASYSGDGNNTASNSVPLTQTVNKGATTLALFSGINPSIAGQSNIVYASLGYSAPGPAAGTVTFTVDGTPQSASFNGYSAAYNTSSLPAGTHTITAAYSGDSNFTSSMSPALTQTINPHISPQYVSPSGSDSNPGTLAAPKLTIQAAINAVISGDTVIAENGTYTGPGNVDLDFGGKNLTVTSQNGAASTVIDCQGSSTANHRGFYLHSGETSAVISGLSILNGYEFGTSGGYYDGGAIFNSNVGVSVQNCILKNNTAGYGGGIANSGSGGGAITVTNCVLTGNVALYEGGGICNSNGSSGMISVTNCTLTGNTAPSSSGGGLYSINYAQGSTINTTILTNDILYGDSGGEIGGAVSTVSYCDIQGGYQAGYVPAGDINADPNFYSDLHLQASSPCLGAGTTSGALATTLDGRTRPSPPSIGAYEAAATGAAATTTTLASSLNPSTAGQSVTFTAKVAIGGGVPTGIVNFSIDGTTQAHVSLSGGTASYATAALTSGSHSVIATYSGNASFAPSASAALTQTVNPIITVTAITSATNPSQYGQQAVFTVTITGKSTVGNGPTGSITLTDAAAGMVLVTRNIFGVTTTNLGYYNLSVGSRQIVAAYSGDKFYGPSTSAPLTQTVSQAGTTTTLTSSLNPAIAGQSVTLTATVATASTANPTGTVTFFVDGAAQPAAVLSSSLTAALTTSALAVGSHVITAVYSGDANFTPGTSAPFTQTVNAHINPLYVSPTGSDSNPGTQTAPKLTIQAAINTTLNGDAVIIGDGTYTGPGNVDLDFGGKNITVASQHGATKTVIDCGGTATIDHRGFYFHGNETNAVISGLTIQNGVVGGSYLGSNNYSGGGIYNVGASLTIQSCIFRNNSASGQGGGLYNSIFRGTVIVSNCVFVGNTANTGGAYADNSEGGTTSLVSCTITGNKATGTGYGGTPGGGGIYSFDHPYPATNSILILTNDILYGDTGGEVVNAAAVNAAANNCDVQGGYPGTGNINAGPLFVDPATDLRLRPASPCIGTGTSGPSVPTTTLDGQARPDPPSIGAYEAALPSFLINDTEASIAYTGGWFYSQGRGTGDLRDDVHAALADGSAVTYSFLGTGVSFLTETNSDEGAVAVYVDGVFKQTVNCATPVRQVQQSAYSISGLPAGLHSIKLVKTGGTFLVVDGFQVTTVPDAAPVNIINDTYSAILYGGPSGTASWFYSPSRGLGDAGDDVHAAMANGSYLICPFNGTAVTYVTETNSDEGSVDIYLDGVPQTTVSCYSAVRKSRQSVWIKTGLTAGPHSLALGKRDGQFMLLDALLVTPSPTVVNDTDPGLLYGGSGWFYYFSRGVGDLSDDVHATQNNGDGVSYTFTGTSVSYVTETNPDEGAVAVYIDGVFQKTVNCVTPARQVQQTVFSASGLAPGSHTITLVKTSGIFLVLDALIYQ